MSVELDVRETAIVKYLLEKKIREDREVLKVWRLSLEEEGITMIENDIEENEKLLKKLQETYKG